MPSCPICGKEVQSSTTYCPACGTDLRQVSAGPTMPTGNYRPAYSNPQQGTTIPTGGQSHGHRKYILAIVAIGIIALLIGGLIGYSLPVPPDFTTLTGTVTLGSQLNGTPNQIIFDSSATGNLSSAIFSNHSYVVNLPIGGPTYSVTIEWQNLTSTPVLQFTGAVPLRAPSVRPIPTLLKTLVADHSARQNGSDRSCKNRLLLRSRFRCHLT